MKTKLISTQDYLLLIDEESKITKEWKGYSYKKDVVGGVFKHFYTTNDWYNDAKIVVAYYPLTKESEELDLPLLPNPFEEKVEFEFRNYISKCQSEFNSNKDIYAKGVQTGFIAGYKAAQSKQYSLEDVIAFGKKCFYKGFDKSENDDANCYTAWREKSSDFIQSLSLQQLPKEFIPEYEEYEVIGARDADGYPVWSKRLKTTTNLEGKQELVGRYK